LLRIDLHGQRDNLFIDAVQDVCLLSLCRHGAEGKPAAGDTRNYLLGVIDAEGNHTLGSASVSDGGEPWTLPVPNRKAQQSALSFASNDGSGFTVSDYGYQIRVGKVVPTREGERLHKKKGKGTLPLVWASDIRPDGTFAFANGRRRGNEPWYVPPTPVIAYAARRPSVLIQRTSNRDQRRRLNAAAVSSAFLHTHRHRGFVAENHVIVLEALTLNPLVPPRKLAAVLNSAEANLRFSAVAGSFSVSATILGRLLLPDPKELPDMRKRDFAALLAKAFGPIDAVLKPLEAPRNPKDTGHEAGDPGSHRPLHEHPSFKGRAAA
jgi:adenine-specific DNA-methyltransferase